jgi:hypothetical protein
MHSVGRASSPVPVRAENLNLSSGPSCVSNADADGSAKESELEALLAEFSPPRLREDLLASCSFPISFSICANNASG